MTIEAAPPGEVIIHSGLTLTTWAAPRASLEELTRCAESELGTAAWWTCLAHRLDALRDEMAGCDIEGLAAQVIADAPQFAATAAKLPTLDADVQGRATELRLRIADLAGSRTAAKSIQLEVKELLRRVRTLYRMSDQLLLEAYERDLGGD